MITQMVKVVQAESGYLLVRPLQNGCSSCSSGSCGVTNFAQLFGRSSRSFKVTVSDGKFEAGDIIELLLDESLFMRLVTVQYLLPLVSMFVLVLAVSFFSQHLVIQLFATISGLLIGMIISRYLMHFYEYRLGNGSLRVKSLQAS